MADYKILLVCSGGISTSLLMKKIEKYAVLLLGPQVAYRKKQIADSVAIPVAVIAPQDYAFCNVENILKEVDVLLGKSNA